MTDTRAGDETPDDPTTRQVWIVEPTSYDQYGIEGVYDSEADAKWHWPSDSWRLTQEGDWVSGGEDLATDTNGLRLYRQTVKRAGGVPDGRRQ